MGKVFITSDTHFSHDKEFLWGPRGFNNQWEMNEEIIKRWNSVVSPEDDVYVLGDIIMSDAESGIAALKELKGNIHIICGNHDTDAKKAMYEKCWNVVEICDAKYIKLNKQMFFLSHYPSLTSNLDADKPLSKRIINLCGHTHTQDEFLDMDKGLIYHVELDAHDCYPVQIETIIKDIQVYMEEK